MKHRQKTKHIIIIETPSIGHTSILSDILSSRPSLYCSFKKKILDYEKEKLTKMYKEQKFIIDKTHFQIRANFDKA